ncbi:MAG: lantibiotic dehydratase [Kofleriaceae bacterium]
MTAVSDVPRWSTLPAYLVRLAGFAFDRLTPLQCKRAAAAVDQLDDAEAARIAAGRALDEALGQERYADHPAFDDPALRKQVSRHVKQVRAFGRKLADAPPPHESFAEVIRVVPHIATAVDSVVRTHSRWQEAGLAFEAVFAEQLEETRIAIRHLYADERLQEAVFLESPRAYERIQQLTATQGPRNARARQRERLAVMYAQRFCAKNDTNSICGPHGVAYLTAAPGAAARIEIVTEDASRESYFSQWAAQRLLDEAVTRAGDDARLTWRAHPTARVDDSSVSWCVMDHDATSTFRRRYARSVLPPGGAQLLRGLTTPRTGSEVTALALESGLDGGTELDAFLAELVAAGVVLRGPMLSPGLFHPLRAVATEVARWLPSAARTWALEEISAIEGLLAGFAKAPLHTRLELFQQLVTRFEASTGITAQRGEGLHYADRAVLHEDCHVEVDCQLGAARATLDGALPALVSALELPLELARERVRAWFRTRFGDGVRIPALEVHRAFDDSQVLEAPVSTPRAAALQAAIDRVGDVIERAVAGAGGGTARIATADLRDALSLVAPPARAGYVSADLMLRRRGDGSVDLVLGEVHGFCWLPTSLLDVLPPDHRERVVELMRAAVRELERGGRAAECVFLHTQATDRRFPIAAADLQMVIPSDRPAAVDFGTLDMRLHGDELEFLSGDEQILPLVAYTRYPFLLYTSRLAPLFDDFSERYFPDSLLPASLRQRDAPRLAIDDLVFRRRLWRRSAGSLRAALVATTESTLFRRAQTVRRELGCGTQVFVSFPGEPKPVLLDFHNVFLLEAVVNLLERQPDDATVKISEMVPGPDELVASGPDGLRTSELRMGFYRP